MKRPTQVLLRALRPARPTRVVDVGANPLGAPVYNMLLKLGACEVVGFEPDARAFEKLQHTRSPHETYLPYAVGDGDALDLNIYRGRGLASAFEPNPGAFSYLGRSAKNMRLVDRVSLTTRRLDDMDEIDAFDLLKIDIQGGEVRVFRGAEGKLRRAVAVITELRYYPIYLDEPMMGGVDCELRRQGFQLLKFLYPKTRIVPNSHTYRLNRTVVRSQLVDGDAVYLRDLARVDEYDDEDLKHLAILATSVFMAYDIALFCIDRLVERGAVPVDTAARLFTALPDDLKSDETGTDGPADRDAEAIEEGE